MLKHTGRIWHGFFSAKKKKKKWQYWSIPHTVLTGSSWYLPVPSTEISTEWRHFCDANYIVKIGMEELKRFSQIGFQKHFQNFRFAGSNVSYTKELFVRKVSLNFCTLLYFSKLKWFREIFETTTYILLTNSDSHNVLSSNVK
jgi:hypothetical protein